VHEKVVSHGVRSLLTSVKNLSILHSTYIFCVLAYIGITNSEKVLFALHPASYPTDTDNRPCFCGISLPTSPSTHLLPDNLRLTLCLFPPRSRRSSCIVPVLVPVLLLYSAGVPSVFAVRASMRRGSHIVWASTRPSGTWGPALGQRFPKFTKRRKWRFRPAENRNLIGIDVFWQPIGMKCNRFSLILYISR